MVWTGWGDTSWPARDDDRPVHRFGWQLPLAADLAPRIRQLEDDFYASDARFTVADPAEMGKLAASQFRQKHPQTSEAAVQALAWCYTCDCK